MQLIAAFLFASLALAQDKPGPVAKTGDVYDEKADAAAQITAALAKAKRDNQRVMVQWGANWCSWCKLLHQECTSDQALRMKLMYEYQLVLVDVGRFDKNVELGAKYGASFKESGIPYLTLLDADGKPLANQETGSFEIQGSEKPAHDTKKLLEFLTQHQAPYLVAKDVHAAALERAKKEGKRVFEHFGAP